MAHYTKYTAIRPGFKTTIILATCSTCSTRILLNLSLFRICQNLASERNALLFCWLQGVELVGRSEVQVKTVRKIQTHRALFGHLFFNIRCVTVHKDEREKRTEQY